MESRHISVYDYLQALQQEYICLEIRSKIYVHKNDRDYFKKLMEKKAQNILALAKKNELACIFDDEAEYMGAWKKIVPEYGMPKFIYNIVNVTDKQLSFPYKGTVVEVIDGGKYGVTERVNFSDNTVTIMLDGQPARFGYEQVKRLNHEQTDEFFYYYPNNHFKAQVDGSERVGKLQSYDMKKKTAILNFDGIVVTLQNDEIRRIL